MSQIGKVALVFALMVAFLPVKSFAQDDRSISQKAGGVVEKVHSCKGSAPLATYLKAGWSPAGQETDIENMLAVNSGDRAEFEKCLFNVGFGLDNADPARGRLDDLVAAVEKKPARPSYRRPPRLR